MGWRSGTTLGLLIAAVALLIGFVVVERRAANPLLPLRIALDRNRGGSFLASLLVGAGLFAMFLFLTYYFQINLHYSALRSGFAFLPFSAGIIVAAGVASQALPRTGPKPLMLGGMISATAGLALLLTIGQQTAWVTHVLPAEILMSLGLGFVFVPLSSTALVGVGEHDAGVASALLNTTQQVGGSLGTALLNTLYAGAVSTYIATHLHAGQDAHALQLPAFIHGYHVAFAVGAALLATAAVAVAVLVRAGKDDLTAEPEARAGAA